MLRRGLAALPKNKSGKNKHNTTNVKTTTKQDKERSDIKRNSVNNIRTKETRGNTRDKIQNIIQAEPDNKDRPQEWRRGATPKIVDKNQEDTTQPKNIGIELDTSENITIATGERKQVEKVVGKGAERQIQPRTELKLEVEIEPVTTDGADIDIGKINAISE